MNDKKAARAAFLLYIVRPSARKLLFQKRHGVVHENFNAAIANIQIQGLDIHPGMAKDKMINSQLIGIEIEYLLPKEAKPEYLRQLLTLPAKKKKDDSQLIIHF